MIKIYRIAPAAQWRRRNLNLNRIKIILIIFISLFFSFLACFWVNLNLYSKSPAGNNQTESQIDILPGQKFKNTVKILSHKNIIKYPFYFKLLALMKGYDTRIRAGEYFLSPSLTPNEIFEIMVQGRVRLYKLMIPEGYNLREIACAAAKAGLVSEHNFMKTAINSELVRQYGISAETFEGYLFPETYFFSKNISPEKIIHTMLKTFRTVFTTSFRNRAKKLGFSLHQIVTLASIIEKETGTSFERPLISSVFHNRLKKKMRLASDPTVIYGIDEFNGNLSKKDILTATPYNTYKIKGLPPGPISNPGFESIEAALYPADTQFFYFVSRKDKTHEFSTNIIDHNRAVRKYQLGNVHP